MRGEVTTAHGLGKTAQWAPRTSDSAPRGGELGGGVRSPALSARRSEVWAAQGRGNDGPRQKSAQHCLHSFFIISFSFLS
jgi:hypothetical protein